MRPTNCFSLTLCSHWRGRLQQPLPGRGEGPPAPRGQLCLHCEGRDRERNGIRTGWLKPQKQVGHLHADESSWSSAQHTPPARSRSWYMQPTRVPNPIPCAKDVEMKPLPLRSSQSDIGLFSYRE